MADVGVMPYACRLSVTRINETSGGTYRNALRRRCIQGPGQVGVDGKHRLRRAEADGCVSGIDDGASQADPLS